MDTKIKAVLSDFDNTLLNGTLLYDASDMLG